ncbi:MAG: DUF3887 domain-containing protein [Vulcanimicrobiota bacterium]
MKKFSIIALLVICLLITGQAFAQKPGGQMGQDSSAPNMESIKDENLAEKEGTVILENLIEGLEKNNYEQFTRDFDEQMKKEVTREKFKELQKDIMGRLGKMTNKTYLAALQRTNYTILLWEGQFADFDGDILLTLTLTRIENKIKVAGFYFH